MEKVIQALSSTTVEQIWQGILWLVGAIGALSALVGFIIKMRKFFRKKRHDEISEIVKAAIASEITPVANKMSDLEDAIKTRGLNSDKDFLVRFLADVEQNQLIDEIEKERFYEVYSEYQSLGGNSYIHEKVEKLKSEGKL